MSVSKGLSNRLRKRGQGPYTRWDGRVRRGTYHAVIDWEARDCTGCGTAWTFTAGRMGWGVGGWARRGKVGKEVKQRRRREEEHEAGRGETTGPGLIARRVWRFVSAAGQHTAEYPHERQHAGGDVEAVIVRTKVDACTKDTMVRLSI